jgi:hypothetical protein
LHTADFDIYDIRSLVRALWVLAIDVWAGDVFHRGHDPHIASHRALQDQEALLLEGVLQS